MSSIPAASNGQVVTYPPCQPWCFYQPEDPDQDDGAPDAQDADANRHHRNSYRSSCAPWMAHCQQSPLTFNPVMPDPSPRLSPTAPSSRKE